MAAKAKAKTTKTAAKKTAAKKAATNKPATKKAAASKKSSDVKKAPASKKTLAAKKAPTGKQAPAGKKASAVKKTTAAKKKGSVKKATSPETKTQTKTKTKTKTQAKAKTKSTVKKRTVSRTPPRPMVDSAFRNYTPYEPKKSEKYMSDDQLVHFRQILNNWRRELMEEVDRTVHHMQDEAANFPDPADRATQEEEFSIELRTRDRERKLIKKIDQTIDRLDQDDYGYCDTCGIEIGLRRLEARPTATQCVDCKSLDEIKERQIHG